MQEVYKMEISKKITAIILCCVIYCVLFILAVLGIKFYCLIGYRGWMIVISLLMFVLGIKTWKQKEYQVASAALSLFLVLSVVIPAFHDGDGFYYRIEKEPVSGQRFGVQLTDRTFLSKKGRVIYYKYNGFFLYNPKSTEYGEVSMDMPFFVVDSEGIYVDCTFMWDGAQFPVKDNYEISLDNPEITEISIHKATHTFIDSFYIEKDNVIYSNSDANSEMIIVEISSQQYQEIITLLESAKLGDIKGNDEYSNYIYADGKNDSTVKIYIDGEEIFQSIAQILEIQLRQSS